MKQFRIIILLLLIGLRSFAQVLNPEHWSWRAEQVKGEEYKLVFTIKMDTPWHVYSQTSFGEDGPRPTSFTFDKNPDIELIGKTSESGPKIKDGMDEVYEMKVKYFDEVAVFEQHIRIKKPTTVKGSLEYMICTHKSCKQPTTKSFAIAVPAKDDKAAKVHPDTGVKGSAALLVSPGSDTDAVQAFGADTASVSSDLKGMTPYYQHFFDKSRFEKPVNDCGRKEETLTTWLAFILGFAGGLLALLTPCVFPMIPLTVGFFIKRSENKTKGRFESVFYGFCIMSIFFLLSMPFLFFNLSPNALNALSTNLWLNLFFFVVFIGFALSFFGYFEIALPSSLATKVDNASNAGGLIGIFFMAMALVLVSFSCTGPILGTLLGSMLTSPNGKLNLVVGMTSFGLAMGMPFSLFAVFPNLLKSLPRSGGWMDSVKKVFAFAELILAMKFISNADLVGHWGIVKREIFLSVWVVIAFSLFLYLIGVIKFKSEGAVNTKSPIRLGIALFVLAFTLYSGYGVLGNDLPLLSGFPPPNYYSIFPKKTECPDDLSCFHDYDEALAYARKVNKPIFIDFTGYNCVNCRRMEEKIWTDPAVYLRLSQKYVIVSLYVDDYQRGLPDSIQYASPINGEKRSSYGAKWSDFQSICFNTNTQPQYVLVSPDEHLLNPSWKGYDPEPKKFQDFLDCGLDAFQRIQGK